VNCPMCKRMLGNRGFAIAELIVAVGILTAALIGGMMFLQTSMLFVKTQCGERIAGEIASSQMEILRSRSAAPLRNCSARIVKTNLPGFDELRDAECLLDVSDHENTPGVKIVTVTVRWRGWRRTRQVKQTSLVRAGRRR
jgi:hypothetical protein